jgi:hypothetical protein
VTDQILISAVEDLIGGTADRFLIAAGAGTAVGQETAAQVKTRLNLSGINTGDQDLSSYATTAAVAAGYQPLDSDLTAIAALSTTSFGRALLALADAAALRTAAAVGTMSTKSTYQIQIALSGYDMAVSAGTKKGQCRVPITGTITGFAITCDPANKPSAAAIQCDLNTVNLSTGALTTCLSSVASIATGAASSTGGAISGSPSVAVGDQLAVDIDQGSDGKGLLATITITAT